MLDDELEQLRYIVFDTFFMVDIQCLLMKLSLLCEVILSILLVIVISNLLFALGVFVLIGKPTLVQGWLARFVGLQAEWQFGSLSTSERERIDSVGRRLGYLSLLALFIWSFLSGVLLRLLTA